MNFLRKNLGLGLILLGVVLLLVLHLLHLTFVNTLLLVPLIFILAGIVFHVWMMKRDSLY